MRATWILKSVMIGGLIVAGCGDDDGGSNGDDPMNDAGGGETEVTGWGSVSELNWLFV